jgi:hypothetical protein
MRNLRTPVFLLFALGVLVMALAPGTVNATRDGEKVKIQDDCDPADPRWTPTGGCLGEEGTVTTDEFDVFSFMTTGSPLVASVIGHPAWRNDPGYLVLPFGDDLKVLNTGGRNHTFTEVANFGGGNVPPLSSGLTLAPECPGAQVVPAGGRTDVSGLNVGLHKFQCCIHPWMRTVVSVE